MTKPTNPAPEVVALATAMYASRLLLRDVIKEAGLAPSTWTRWSRGADPKTSNLTAMREAIARLSEKAK